MNCEYMKRVQEQKQKKIDYDYDRIDDWFRHGYLTQAEVDLLRFIAKSEDGVISAQVVAKSNRKSKLMITGIDVQSDDWEDVTVLFRKEVGNE